MKGNPWPYTKLEIMIRDSNHGIRDPSIRELEVPESKLELLDLWT